MTDKRPWTANMKAMQFGEFWYVVDERERAIVEVISANSEADARLFAASAAMYEALERFMEYHVLQLGLTADTVVMSAALTALRAANPDAFTETPTVQASEPAGDSK